MRASDSVLTEPTPAETEDSAQLADLRQLAGLRGGLDIREDRAIARHLLFLSTERGSGADTRI
jgi:hypothetical protein